ncbi:MAG: hypothetical protein SFX18_10850 [Pirellulales bacterium]|nr:hypothetical protein [Pirellulales bacterium]
MKRLWRIAILWSIGIGGCNLAVALANEPTQSAHPRELQPAQQAAHPLALTAEMPRGLDPVLQATYLLGKPQWKAPAVRGPVAPPAGLAPARDPAPPQSSSVSPNTGPTANSRGESGVTAPLVSVLQNSSKGNSSASIPVELTEASRDNGNSGPLSNSPDPRLSKITITESALAGEEYTEPAPQAIPSDPPALHPEETTTESYSTSIANAESTRQTPQPRIALREQQSPRPVTAPMESDATVEEPEPEVPDNTPAPEEVITDGVISDAGISSTEGEDYLAEQGPVGTENGESFPTETIRERYPNAMIKVERNVTQDAEGNFINHGPFVQFDERGRMTGGGEYNFGKKQGKWTRSFAMNEGPMFSGPMFKEFTAPFVSEATFENDQLQGTWKISDAKNRKVLEWQFENGKCAGVNTWYFPTGLVRREIPYKHGEIDGDVLEYGRDGQLVKRESFFQGHKLALQTDWYEPHVKRAEGSTLMSKEIIKPNFDFWNGVATFTVIGKSGQNQRHGQWTWWHKNGQKQMEGRFENDLPSGRFTWWYANGQKQIEGDYLAGKQQGKFQWWHASGGKMLEGEYQAGLQVNQWTRWNEAGKVLELAKYDETGEQIDFKQFPGEGGTGAAANSALASQEPAKVPTTIIPPGTGVEPQPLPQSANTAQVKPLAPSRATANARATAPPVQRRVRR